MSEPPKVLTAGGAAVSVAAGGGKKTPNSRGRNRRGKSKKKAAAAVAAAGGESAATTESQQAAATSATAETNSAVEDGHAFAKPAAATATAASQQSGNGGKGGGKTRSRGTKGTTPKRGAPKSSSPPAGGDSPNNPQTGSPPEQSSNPIPAPRAMVAGGGTAGATPLAFNDAGARKAENRSPDKDADAAAKAARRPRYRDNDNGDDFADDDAFDNNSDDDAEKRIGEITKPPPGSSGGGITPDDLYGAPPEDPHSALSAASVEPKSKATDLIWLLVCFLGIMGSFVVYGLLLEYTTSGGRKLHELSFLFVTSSLYTVTAAAGRYVRQETPTTIPPARFAVLGLTSMGSTFFSVRSLRYVIYPIQVLAKSCKPVPVMIMGAFMGKKYPLKKYINVCLIVAGVGLFMGGGSSKGKKGGDGDGDGDDGLSASSQAFGILLLFISLCFDGGTGAYEDKLMSVHSVGPFDLMYNIQLGKTILAGVGLLVFNQVHLFIQMCQEMGFLLVALGLSGAMGQVFIFVTISKFGALTCSIIGLARKVTTLVASIYFYGHELNGTQFTGLVVAVGAMVMNFWGKKGKKGGGGHGGGHGGGGEHGAPTEEETEAMLGTKVSDLGTEHTETSPDNGEEADIELGPVKSRTKTIT